MLRENSVILIMLTPFGFDSIDAVNGMIFKLSRRSWKETYEKRVLRSNLFIIENCIVCNRETIERIKRKLDLLVMKL